jgi:hypothetical protein
MDVELLVFRHKNAVLRLLADDLPHDRRRKSALEAERGDVGVEDHAIHGRSGEVGVTSGVDVGQEGVQFLVGVENVVLGEIVGRLDQPDVLAPRELVDGHRTTFRRPHRVVVRAARGHRHLPLTDTTECRTAGRAVSM